MCSAAQSCPTLCDPVGCSLPGSLHGISQARILQRVAISSPRGSSQPRDQTHISCISCIGKQVLYHSPTWEAPKAGLKITKKKIVEKISWPSKSWCLQFRILKSNKERNILKFISLIIFMSESNVALKSDSHIQSISSCSSLAYLLVEDGAIFSVFQSDHL